MSNPSGPDEDANAAPDETPANEAYQRFEPEPEFESAEPTVDLSGPDAQFDDPTQRRYSAPSGFDVRSTEIIRTSPEPATEVMATSAAPTVPAALPPVASPPRTATPQAIPPRPSAGRHRSWGLVLVLLLVIAALVAVAVLGTVWFKRKSSPKVSQEDLVRQTINEFDTAIQKGDLPKLRGITCGTFGDNYVKYPDKDWAMTHQRVAAAKQYPVVASIDQVVVNDQHAEANVTTFMAYAPQTRSTRSFDLQFLDDRWKICEGPMS